MSFHYELIMSSSRILQYIGALPAARRTARRRRYTRNRDLAYSTASSKPPGSSATFVPLA